MDTTIKSVGTMAFSVDGMTCGHCVQAVTKALSAVPGVRVRSVAVGSAVIEASDGSAARRAITALEEAGYPATVADNDAREPGARTGSDAGCCGASQAAAPGEKAGPGSSGACY